MDLDTALSILGILLAILNFFVSPDTLKSFINKTILSTRQKRIDSLKESYDLRKVYRDYRGAWQAAMIAYVSSGLYQLTLFVFWIAIYNVSLIRDSELSMIFSLNGFLTSYFLFTPLTSFTTATKLHNDVVNLDRYYQETLKKLTKLGLSIAEATELLGKEVAE